MILKKTVTGIYLFIINIYAITQLGNLKFFKIKGSHYLIIPFYNRCEVKNCEIAIRSTKGDIIYTSFSTIYCHVDIEKNMIKINLDKVPKNKSYEYRIHLFTIDGEEFQSDPFIWKRILGKFSPIKTIKP